MKCFIGSTCVWQIRYLPVKKGEFKSYSHNDLSDPDGGIFDYVTADCIFDAVSSFKHDAKINKGFYPIILGVRLWKNVVSFEVK